MVTGWPDKAASDRSGTTGVACAVQCAAARHARDNPNHRLFLPTGHHDVIAGCDLLGGQVNIVTGPVQNIIQFGRKFIGNRGQGIPRLNLVIDTIHRRHLEHLPNPQAVWRTVQDIIVGPQEGFGLDLKLRSDAEEGITGLDSIIADRVSGFGSDVRLKPDLPDNGTQVGSGSRWEQFQLKIQSAPAFPVGSALLGGLSCRRNR